MIVKLTPLERLLHRLHVLPTPMMDAFGGIIFGKALTIAVRRGLFEAASFRRMTVDELAMSTGLHPKAVALMADAFVAGGYLVHRRGTYSLSAEGKKWLLPSSAFYLGNLIRYFETLYDRWADLEASLERGGPPRPYFDGFDENDWGVYVYGMSDLARLLLPEVRKLISLPHGESSVLDIGGSHGLYAMDCCRRNPHLKATIMDFDAALRHTARIVKEERLADRVTLLGGDFLETDFPAHQDCVLLFNVIHGFSEDKNRTLVQHALDCLKPGGRLYVLDQFKDARHRRGLSALVPLMVGLNLLNEIGGNSFTKTEVKSWCSMAKAVHFFRLRMPGVGMIEAIG